MLWCPGFSSFNNDRQCRLKLTAQRFPPLLCTTITTAHTPTQRSMGRKENRGSRRAESLEGGGRRKREKEKGEMEEGEWLWSLRRVMEVERGEKMQRRQMWACEEVNREKHLTQQLQVQKIITDLIKSDILFYLKFYHNWKGQSQEAAFHYSIFAHKCTPVEPLN